MDITLILAIVFLATVAVNTGHWRFRRGDRLLYFPQSGWHRFLLTALAVATAISAVASLLSWLPSWVFLLITFVFITTQELYSIWLRQTQTGQRV